MRLGMVMCVAALSFASTAIADPAKLLLIGRPEVESPSVTGVDIVSGAIERGAKEAIEHRDGVPTQGGPPYDRVLSIREIEGEDTKFITPLEKYEMYSEKRLKVAIQNQYSLRNQPIPRGFLQPILYRSPAGELVVELEIWELPKWHRLQTRRVGGCGASLQEVAEAARDAAAKISRGETQSGTIEPVVSLLPYHPISEGSATVLAGSQVTLDSCSTSAPDHDAFLVKWTQDCAFDSRLCVMPRETMRPRQTVDLALPGTYKFMLTIITDRNDCSNCTKTIMITALERPKAAVIVREDTGAAAKGSTDSPVDGEPSAGMDDTTHHPSAAEYQKVAAAFYAGMEEEQSLSSRTIRVQRNRPTRVYLDAGGARPLLQATPSGCRTASPLATNPRISGPVVTSIMPITSSGSVRYHWEQLEGTTVALIGEGPVCYFDANWSNPGTYVFRLTVDNGGHKDSQQVSILVAPKIFADAGLEESIDVGEKLRLDNGSYDVLDEAPLFSWAVDDSSGSARILEPNARTPTFIAERPGSYTVRVFVRARRIQGDRKLWDVATAAKIIHVSGGRHNLSLAGSGNHETRPPVVQPNRDFLGGSAEYMYRVASLVFRARVRVGYGRESNQWKFKVDIADVDFGVLIGRSVETSAYVFAGVSGIPRSPTQVGPAIGAKVMRRLTDRISLAFDMSAGILFIDDDRPFIGTDLGLSYSFK